MAEETQINGWLNPLAFIKAEEPWSNMNAEEVTLEDILEYLCTPGLTSDVDSLLARHNEICKGAMNLFVAPAEDNILSKLVWPLRHAKGCYLVGNYLGTIALCGMVAEMSALLFYEISDVSLNNRSFESRDEKSIYGSSFEILGQERLVSILLALGIIDKPLKSHFEIIRNKRREYLHLYSKHHSDLEKDAIEVFSSTVTVLCSVIGQDIQDGKLQVNPELLRYLERFGIAEKKVASDET